MVEYLQRTKCDSYRLETFAILWTMDLRWNLQCIYLHIDERTRMCLHRMKIERILGEIKIEIVIGPESRRVGQPKMFSRFSRNVSPEFSSVNRRVTLVCRGRMPSTSSSISFMLLHEIQISSGKIDVGIRLDTDTTRCRTLSAFRNRRNRIFKRIEIHCPLLELGLSCRNKWKISAILWKDAPRYHLPLFIPFGMFQRFRSKRNVPYYANYPVLLIAYVWSFRLGNRCQQNFKHLLSKLLLCFCVYILYRKPEI